MSISRDREDEIFRSAARYAPGRERDALVRVECGGDQALEAAVRGRLADEAAASETRGELDPHAATEIVPMTPEIEAQLAALKPEEPGDRIQHYKLLQKIGEGGFGTVWVADQEQPVRRRVALKIIKLGMNTNEMIARFEQERQALAMMDHPNIARVFDAGATQYGRPFFVMELVRGVKITEYCDAASLSTVDRLQLFIAVCRGVQHAHQKGIIHRDLKPSNILVTLHDGVPVPKIIDFGVAKATQQQRLTDLTIYTQFEQMIGTPLYMSPEQAEMSGLDIDTRSDIYSLGVLLYELLTGRTPFDPKEFSRCGLDEMRRVIREQEPQRPSIVLHTMAAEARTLVARHQQADEGGLIGLLRGDLDWIVMKALEKDRARRYDTANGLAADIERHLAHEPILARPPSQLYRIRRFARRHRVAFFSGVSVAAALVIGSGVSVWQAVRAEREARRANTALAELRGMTPALVAEARELAARDRFDEAIQKLGYAIQLRPESAEYLRERAALLECQLRLGEAAADFRRILALHPGDASALANATLCERLQAGPRELGGGLLRTSLAELYAAMTAEGRPAAELMPLARVLGNENQIARQFWLERLRLLPNATALPFEERLKTGASGLLELDLRGTKISDLTPLQDMPLGGLDLSGCAEVRSLEALRGMPLRTLSLAETGVTSLAPLAGMRTLGELTFKVTPVSDLAPLQGLPLRKLVLSRTNVGDLSPLEGMALTHLEIGHTRVTDLTPLAAMPLKMLECSYTPVASYAPLARLPLEYLLLQGVRVGDLGFVRALPLKVLMLAGARELRGLRVLGEVRTLELLVLPGNPLELNPEEIEGIEALKQHPALERISATLAEGSSVDSAEAKAVFWRKWDATMRWWRPLRAAGIKTTARRLPDETWMVVIQDQPLADLGVFTGSDVSVLDVSGCHLVDDLSPLHELPLTTLSIAHTAVTNLAPLRGTGLRGLWMADTRVTDLSPLRGLHLKTLYMDKCELLTDLTPLLDLAELEEVVLPENAANVSSLLKLPKLRHISYTYDRKTVRPASAIAEFSKELHDLQWLRALRAAKTELTAAQLADGTWKLAVSDASFADLKLLAGARISELSLSGTKVTDLRPLAGLPLRRLRLDATPCTDVSPLAGIPAIESLVLPAGAKAVGALHRLTALKRVAFEADANGEPTLEATAFWAGQGGKDGR